MSHTRTSVVVSVPGSIGNMGPGLDVLGCAVTGAHDEVAAVLSDEPGITIACAGHPELPTDPTRNTASVAAHAAVRVILERRSASLAQLTGKRGISLSIRKGLPLSGGQGGSAASAVAGAVAANELLRGALSTNELMQCALEAEMLVAGRHLDNIAPSLLGGIALVRSVDPVDVVRVPAPAGAHIVLASPDYQLATINARAALPNEIPRATAIHQMAQCAAIVAACFTGDLRLLGRSIDDRIAEPARTPLLRGFSAAKLAAIEQGALGVSISGAGPTSFALCESVETASKVADAMRSAYLHAGSSCHTRLCEIDNHGAKIESAT